MSSTFETVQDTKSNHKHFYLLFQLEIYIDDESRKDDEMLVEVNGQGRKYKGQTEQFDNYDIDMESDAPQVELDQDSDSEYEGLNSSKRPNKQIAPIRLKKKPKKKPASTHVTPYPCNYCGKEIIGKGNLEAHIKRIHLKTKDSPCQICPKSFFGPAALESHMLSVHTRLCNDCNEYVVETERWPEGTDMSKIRYVTCQCGAQVIVRCKKGRKREHEDDPDSADVKTHKRKDQSQYACSHCGKLFTSKAHCVRHAQMHTGVKDIQCDYCDETFRYQGSLKKHLQRKHRIFSYVCDICRVTFSSRSDLDKHLSRKHSQEHIDNTAHEKQSVRLEKRERTLFTGTSPQSSERKLTSITQRKQGTSKQEAQGLSVNAPQNPVVAVSRVRAPQNPVISGVRAPQNPVVSVSVADGESLDSITYNIVQQVLQGNDQVFTEDGKTVIIRTVHE